MTGDERDRLRTLSFGWVVDFLAQCRGSSCLAIELRGRAPDIVVDARAALNSSGHGASRATILAAALLALDSLYKSLSDELDAELARDNTTPKA
jgi:hypothetical protein